MAVDFENSHALFPTVTTANASAFATGHGLGDTGDFANTIWTRQCTGSSVTPFLEDDRVLRDLYSRGAYMPEPTLLDVARDHGFNTAVVGKLGPAAIQAINLKSSDESFHAPATILVDDSTGRLDDASNQPKGVLLALSVIAALQKAGLAPIAPDRLNGIKNTVADNGYSGTYAIGGTLTANGTQERYFANVTTQVILERFRKSFYDEGRPFLLVFWSRDPDGTQHNQGDKLDSLDPGINGSTSKAAVRNAEGALGQILATLDMDNLSSYTDIIVVAIRDSSCSSLSRLISSEAENEPLGRAKLISVLPHIQFQPSHARTAKAYRRLRTDTLPIAQNKQI